jgi:hypothetical protein
MMRLWLKFVPSKLRKSHIITIDLISFVPVINITVVDLWQKSWLANLQRDVVGYAK